MHPAHSNGAVKRARRLRREMTMAEAKLWAALRKLKLNVRRQAPMGRFIADFIHHGARLVIEVDGYWHDTAGSVQRDVERDAWFRRQGYRVLRLKDSVVIENLEQVTELIAAEIGASRIERA